MQGRTPTPMPPTDSASTASADPGSCAAGGWLDRLEQGLLHADLTPSTADGQRSWRQALQDLAGPASTAAPPRVRDLASALLVLIDRLDADARRPTSAMLDLMLRATDALRALQDGGDRSLPATELDDLQFELQALGPGPGLSTPRETRRTAPPPVLGADAEPAGADEPRWGLVEALLAALGPMAAAQAELADALHRQFPDAHQGLSRPLGLAAASLRALAGAARALQAAHPARLPSAPNLLDVVGLRAGPHHCLVPAGAVLACSPGTGPAADGDFDLAAWLGAARAGTPAADTAGAGALRLSVLAGTGTATWVVDELLPRRTVPVQALARHFRPLPGVAGVAVLGGDRPVLVLDPATMEQPPSAASTAPESETRPVAAPSAPTLATEDRR